MVLIFMIFFVNSKMWKQPTCAWGWGGGAAKEIMAPRKRLGVSTFAAQVNPSLFYFVFYFIF